MTSSIHKTLIPDEQQRETALDPARSFIVQAPAGSGKTSLLVQRYLALLATVKSPEEIVAITFTRKAAAEMQNRILEALEQVPSGNYDHSALSQETFANKEAFESKHSLRVDSNCKTSELAKKVLQKDRAEGWCLLQNPRRLRIHTIDAFCGYIAMCVPISSGLFGQGEIVQGANLEKYYRLAAENLLNDFMLEQAEQRLAKDDGRVSKAQQQEPAQISPLQNLLLHLDNDQEYFLALCCDMQKKREQWLPYVIDVKQRDSNKLRSILEQGLQNSIREILEKCWQSFPQELLTECSSLINFATHNLKNSDNVNPTSTPILQCADFINLFADESSSGKSGKLDNVNIWLGLGTFLLNTKGDWRKTIDIRQGFPSKEQGKDKEEKQLFMQMKSCMKEFLAQLEKHEALRQNLLELQLAPAPSYTDAEWQVLCALLEILPLLVAQLKLIFKAEGVVDYTEISMAADRALGYSDAPTELALNLDYRIKHLLVDEFQDTSFAQYRLIEKLISGWENNDGRTLFLVGDPMQSIYRFRQAEVGLFLRVKQEGIGNIALESLQLVANFRSHPKVIGWINANFPYILPDYADVTVGSVPFMPCEAMVVNDDFAQSIERVTVKTLVDGLAEDEAHCILNEIKHLLQQAQGQAQTQTTTANIAILVQARTHSTEILKVLKSAQIPYQAVELESLQSSIVIQDLFTLTSALTDSTAKIAWLAILRAPWCGISLHDLYAIANHSNPLVWQNVCDYEKLGQLSVDGACRIKRFIAALLPLLNNRAGDELRNFVEEAWLRLGGPACYEDESVLEDAEKYFTLLEQYSAQNLKGNLDLEELKKQLENLHLSTNPEHAKVQIMTIHKAKGLEFDHVIVAGLNRKPQADKQQLLLWLLRTRLHGGSDLLLSPIKEAAEKESQIYSYLKGIEQKKSYHEISRLLYVAATRAKKSLHLFACLVRDEKTGDIKAPVAGCLLERLWHCYNEAWLDEKYSDNTVEKYAAAEKPELEDKTDAVDKILMSRLTDDWQSFFTVSTPGDLTTNLVSKNPKTIFDLPDDSLARLGTVIHQCLQKLAHDISQKHYDFANNANMTNYLAAQKKHFKKLLWQNGFYHGLEPYLQKIAFALENMDKDPIGRWILSREHREIRNEYAVTSLQNGEILHLIVDRTFIDQDGKRWIIDYKTSAPNGMSQPEFLKREQEKYQPQLEQYAHAFRQIEDRPICLGLYFPMCQGWVKSSFKC